MPTNHRTFSACGSVWLDAKRPLYQLTVPAKIEELVKDVAAFANTADGGLIVMGIGARVEDGVEVLDHFVPVQRSAVNLTQHLDLIRERITPPPRG